MPADEASCEAAAISVSKANATTAVSSVHKAADGAPFATIRARHVFVSRTYGILLAFIVSPLSFLLLARLATMDHRSAPILEPHRKHPFLSVATGFFCLTVVCLLTCGFESWRRKTPTNISLVALFLVSATFFVKILHPYVPFMELGAIHVLATMAILLMAIVAFTLQSKADIFSKFAMATLGPAIVGLLAAFNWGFLRLNANEGWPRLLYLLIPAVIEVMYAAVLAWDTHLFLSGRWEVGRKEYLFAAVTLLLNMFVFVFLLNRLLKPWRDATKPGRVSLSRVSVTSIQIAPSSTSGRRASTIIKHSSRRRRERRRTL